MAMLTPAAAVPPPTQPRKTFKLRFGRVPHELLDEDDVKTLGDREPIGWWLDGARLEDIFEYLPYQLEPIDPENTAVHGSWDYRVTNAQKMAGDVISQIAAHKLRKNVKVTWVPVEQSRGGLVMGTPVIFTPQAMVETHRLTVVLAAAADNDMFTLTNLTVPQVDTILKAFKDGERIVSHPYPMDSTKNGTVTVTRYINLHQVALIDHQVETHQLDLSTLVTT